MRRLSGTRAPFILLIIVCVAACATLSQELASGEGEQKPRNAVEPTRVALCRVAECPPCIVQVKASYGDGSYASGTGVLVDGNHVLTAAHVVSPRLISWDYFQYWNDGRWELGPDRFQNVTTVEVVFPGRSSGDPAVQDVSVIATHVVVSDSFKHLEWGGKSFLISDDRRPWNELPHNGDLALLSLPTVPEWAVPTRLANEPPKTGDWLTSVGLESPEAIRVHVAKLAGHGEGKAGMNPTDDPNSSYMYFEVQAQHGDSGGPVFNTSGELVGINSSLGSHIETFVNVNVWGNSVFVQTRASERPCTYLGGYAAIKAFLENVKRH